MEQSYGLYSPLPLVLYPCLYHNFIAFKVFNCLLTVSGDKGIRTLDPLLARQVLSQLSYTPIFPILLPLHASFLMGSRGLEPPTSRLSGVRSNQLSYDPLITRFLFV